MMDSFSSTPLGFNNSLAVSEVGQKLLDMYIGSILPAISGKAKSVQLTYLPILGSDVKARLSLSWIISGVLTLLFVKSVVFSSRRFFKDKYPPGPPAIPFFGNLFQLSMDAWVPFTKWKKQYGAIIYLNVAGQPVIVLNTHKAAADLLDRRASIYSDRPNNIVASDFLTGGILFVFMHYGEVLHTEDLKPSDRWRRMRRAAHEALGRGVANNYRPSQLIEAVLLTDGLLKSPWAWDYHIRRAAASMIMSVVYDTPVLQSEDDPSVARVNDFVERIVRAAYPGAHLVEFFTWMRYLPLWMAKWKRDALEWYKKDSIMFEGLYDDVRQRVNGGDPRPSFSSSLVQQGDKHGLNDRQSAWLAATNYAAGAETTSAVLAWFWLAMVAFPDVQKKAQAELDEVVGRGQMPTFTDYERLPYISAIVKESLRWMPVDPVGLPHRVIQDDEYEGYHIPKGAICIANVWALNRDPDIYGADAHEFNPSRHLDEQGKLKPAPADTKEESHVTYGFGRRICLGRHIANNSLFIDIATILWTLSIEPAKDDFGKPIWPDVESSINTGLVVRPVPFGCLTRPRFPDAEAILAQTKEDLGH